jgi:hypothetical protein
VIVFKGETRVGDTMTIRLLENGRFEFERTIRLFAEADMKDLRSWHPTDVPGFNKRIADFFRFEHGIRTGRDFVRWFNRKCVGTSNLRVWLTGYIPARYWEDAENKGNLELLCHTMEARVQFQELYHYNKKMVDSFARKRDDELRSSHFINMYGCNEKMVERFHSIGIWNGGQL